MPTHIAIGNTHIALHQSLSDCQQFAFEDVCSFKSAILGLEDVPSKSKVSNDLLKIYSSLSPSKINRRAALEALMVDLAMADPIESQEIQRAIPNYLPRNSILLRKIREAVRR